MNISTADRHRNLALDLVALKNAEFSTKFVKLILLNKKIMIFDKKSDVPIFRRYQTSLF
jgi:hypothetical protein